MWHPLKHSDNMQPILKKRKKHWIFKVMPLMILCVGIAAFAGLRLSAEAPPRKPKKAEIRHVDTFVAQYETLRTKIRRNSYVQPGAVLSLQTRISAPVMSITNNFKEGAWVEEGQELFRLDPYLFELAQERALAQRASLAAQIEKAHIELESTKKLISAAKRQVNLRSKDVNRRKKLAGKGASSARTLEGSQRDLITAQQDLIRTEQTYETIQVSLKQLEAELRQNQVDIKRAEYDIQHTSVHAPISGLLQETQLVLGQHVSSNDVIANIVDPTAYEIPIHLSQKDLVLLMAGHTGDRAVSEKETDLWHGWRISASFSVGTHRKTFTLQNVRQDSRVSDRTGGLQLRAFLPDLSETALKSLLLRADMYVSLLIEGPVLPKVLQIPRHAVQYSGNTGLGGQLSQQATLFRIEERGTQTHLQQEMIQVVGGMNETLFVVSTIAEGSQILLSRFPEAHTGMIVQTMKDHIPSDVNFPTADQERK